MADTKISALTAAAAAADANEYPINQAGLSRKVSGTQIKAWLGNALNNVYADPLTTGQTPAAAVRTYITNSNIAVPAGALLRVGTFFQWRFNMTKTAAGTAASSIAICVGTLGTTGDTDRVIFTKPAGTAVVDEGWVTIDAVVGSVGVNLGTIHGEFVMFHNLAATGHAVIPVVCQQLRSGLFTNNGTGLIVGLCITTGAADVITINQLTAEAGNL